jgi:RNA polymerase sigma-70 factor, ECF subfamily
MSASSEELLMADWAAILAEHGSQVWRTVYRILRHYADTCDCYQETFLAAWELAQIRPITEWVPLLTCLASRKAIDRLRKRIRAIARNESLQEALELVSDADPASALRAAELLDRLQIGLSELPQKQAEVVWLSCVEGLSHMEIANHLQISSGEVRVLLHRGRGRLSQLLASEFNDVPE